MLILEPFEPHHDLDRLMSWVDSDYMNVVWASKKFSFPLVREQLLGHFNSAEENNVTVFRLVDELETGNNRVVGHAEIDNLGDEIKISRIIINATSRGKGYGTQSMIALIKWIQTNVRSYKDICLTVFTFNSHAIAVYEKVGFELIEVDKGYFTYGEEIWDRAKMKLKV